MHGIIHVELKRYVETKHGAEAWNAIVQQSGLPARIYMPSHPYPDEDAAAIVATASRLTGTPGDAILEDFGEFITPSLLHMYASLIKPEWKTRDLLLNTEDTIHRVVRLKNPGAAPPRLRFEDMGPKQLKFYYDSPRRMSAVAKGIIKGVARHYKESVAIQERKAPDGRVEMTITIK
jgi:hypothetical protein